MQRLFAYGTLMNNDVQKLLLGRSVPSTPFILQGYKIVVCEDGYFNLQESADNCVHGKVLELTVEELFICDQWEELPNYNRYEISDFWLYMRKDYSGRTNDVDNKTFISSHSEEDLFSTIRFFNSYKYKLMNPICDCYLTYPCSFNSNIQSSIPNYSQKEFIRIFKSILDVEITSEIRSNLDVKYLGTHYFDFELDTNQYQYPSDLYYLLNSELNTAVLIFAMPVCLPPVHLLFNAAYAELITHSGKALNEWITASYSISIVARPKLCIFSSSKFDAKLLKFIFNAERPLSKNMDFFSEKAFENECKNNLAQYKTANIYSSQLCVYEESLNFDINYLSRAWNQILTLFIVSIILLQDSAIAELRQDVIDALKKEDYSQKDEYNARFSSIKFYKNLHSFNYPTSLALSKGISNAFYEDLSYYELDDLNSIINKLDELKKNQLSVEYEKAEKNRDDQTNLALSILSILCVFSALIDGHDYIYTLSWLFPEPILSLIADIVFPILIITIFLFVLMKLFGKQ